MKNLGFTRICREIADVAIYAHYPESFCSENLAIRKVFAFSDSGWLPHLFRRGDFLMGFPFVDFQTILSFEIKITLVTLKAFALLLRVLVGFQTSCRRLGGGLLQKKLLPSLCISSQCWRTHLVPWRRGFLPPQWSWIQWLNILRIWILRRRKI